MGIEQLDRYSDGFSVNYHIGDNATGYYGSTIVFKASEEQLQNYLNNELARINYEREYHSQEKVSFDEMWSQSTDSEGDTVYIGSWTGPEPEIKLMDSDCARFITYEVTYDPASQIAICVETEGGGVG